MNRFNRPIRVLCLMPVVNWPNEGWAIGDIRLLQPLELLEREQIVMVKTASMYRPGTENLDWADVVILQRVGDPYSVNLVIRLRRRNKYVVFDIDDLLTDVPAFLSDAEPSRKLKRFLEDCLAMSNIVTVSTLRLKNALQRYNPSIEIIENGAAPATGVCQHQAGTPVNLVVASSDTVRLDFIAPVLAHLQRRHPNKLRIVAIGPPGDFLVQHGVACQRLAKMSYAEFRATLPRLGNAIGIIPLDESLFSGCKSAIKYFDYALAGIPSICSNVPPYCDVIANGDTGLLVDNAPDDWERAITRLMDNTERNRIAAEAQAYCEATHTTTTTALQWRRVLGELIATAPQPLPFSYKEVVNRFRGYAMLLRLGLNKDAYYLAARVLRKEGIGGIRRRLNRFLNV